MRNFIVLFAFYAVVAFDPAFSVNGESFVFMEQDATLTLFNITKTVNTDLSIRVTLKFTSVAGGVLGII